eukprot:jgi/Psemu1/55433/gm1.55433_g
MRFESKYFIKSQRQWHESRGLKLEDRSGTKHHCVDSSDAEARNRYRGSAETSEQRNDRCLHLKHGKCIAEQGARDDGGMGKRENSTIGTEQIKSAPSDFSKKELLQLARRKQRQKLDQETMTKTMNTTAKPSSYEDFADIIRMGSVDSFIDAHHKIKESNRALGIPNSRGMDGLILAILPNSVWINDFFNESRDAIDKIQAKMLLDYSNAR